MSFKYRAPGLSRRTLLATLAGAVSALPGVASAFSERERDDDKPQVRSSYTLNQFLRLTRRELSQIRDDIRRRKSTIAGFSGVMTGWLVYMGLSDWRGMQRLVKDMAKLKDPKARLARLRQEEQRTEDLITNLQASIERLRASRGSPLAISDERLRLADTKDYLEGVQIWIDYPYEGTRG